MSLSSSVSVLALYTACLQRLREKDAQWSERVVVDESTPVTAAKGCLTSWVLWYKEVDLALRDPSLHCPEATNFEGICSVVFIFLSQACFLFTPALS